jgi:hypothetical protein
MAGHRASTSLGCDLPVAHQHEAMQFEALLAHGIHKEVNARRGHAQLFWRTAWQG